MPHRKGRPPAAEPGSRPDAASATVTALSITHTRETAPQVRRSARPARPGPASAFVSLYAPAARRRWWWFAYRCPVCGVHQFGRARHLEDVTGIRRAGCRHEISIVIARTYGQPGAET